MHLFTIHHVAATGGSIMSQAISALTNSILISEINPKAGIAKTESMFNRTSLVEHCCRASGSDLDEILKHEYFSTQLDICTKHARATGRTILLRDHSQSSFNHGSEAPRSDFMDYLQKWKTSSSFTCKILPILSIRPPGLIPFGKKKGLAQPLIQDRQPGPILQESAAIPGLFQRILNHGQIRRSLP